MWTGFWTKALYFNRQRGRMKVIMYDYNNKSNENQVKETVKSELAFLSTTSEASLPGTGQVSHEWMWWGEPTSSWQSSWEPDQIPRLPYLCFAEMPPLSSTQFITSHFSLEIWPRCQLPWQIDPMVLPWGWQLPPRVQRAFKTFFITDSSARSGCNEEAARRPFSHL